MKTSDAADGTKGLIYSGAQPPAQFGMPEHRYGNAEASVHVGDNTASVTLSVPERETQTAQ